MSQSYPPRGVDSCIEALVKRRNWVRARAGGTFDVRERIALSYAIGILRAAKNEGLIEELEKRGLAMGFIDPHWVEPTTTREE